MRLILEKAVLLCFAVWFDCCESLKDDFGESCCVLLYGLIVVSLLKVNFRYHLCNVN